MKPERIRHYHEALMRFAEAYGHYWESGDPQYWGQVNAYAPEASKALALVNIVPVGYAPPVAGGRAYPGLQNILIAEQQYGRFDVLGAALVQGLASLEEWGRRETERRQSPWYWADAVVKGILAVPAYIVSRLVGKSVYEIEASAFGFPLRVLSVVADVSAIYFAGRYFGFW